jgi:hypothetical protein
VVLLNGRLEDAAVGVGTVGRERRKGFLGEWQSAYALIPRLMVPSGMPIPMPGALPPDPGWPPLPDQLRDQTRHRCWLLRALLEEAARALEDAAGLFPPGQAPYTPGSAQRPWLTARAACLLLDLEPT